MQKSIIFRFAPETAVMIAGGFPGRGYQSRRKSVPGHPPNVVPTSAPLVQHAGPFPIESLLPALPFWPAGGVPVERIYSLSHRQFDDLSWFYNTPFIGFVLLVC